jgi:mannosyl-3-phosphoglycerate phosphatase
VIYTDLDGTLLQHDTYSFDKAIPALDRIRQRGIPLVLCSSKTRREIERWRERLDNRHPFISENGGGIFVPREYFAAKDIRASGRKLETTDGYHVLILGTSYAVLRRSLSELRGEGFEIRGFGDMSSSEVARLTGLDEVEAGLANTREFDEPFVFHGDESQFSALCASIERRGLRHTSGGRLHHLMGDNDKGEAANILSSLYRRKFTDIITLALGDSLNDLPMLEAVDHPILVRNHKGAHDPRITLPHLTKADGVGPEGWNEAVLVFFQDPSA